VRGLAERIRYCFAVAGVEYEDERLSLTFGTPGDFSTIKRPEFDAKKAAGEFDIAMGKVPLLIVDGGFKIMQSKAIERYVAKKYGLMGKTDEEAAFVDGVTEHQRDISDAFRKAKTDGKVDEYLTEKLPDALKLVEKAVAGLPGPFLCGPEPSLADVCFYTFLFEQIDDKEKAKAAYEAAPRVCTAVTAFAELPSVKTWLAKRPVTPF